MDAFFASVEQVLNPALKGKPVIVGGNGGRGVVTSASYEARKYGVHSAMPGYQARKLCPKGIFLPNRHAVYREFSAKVFAILNRYSPEVRAISIDEGIVDLTGTERLLGPPRKTARDIMMQIERELGLSASGGLAASHVVAKIAVTLAKPHGFICVPAGSAKVFLQPLPVEVIPGVGPKTRTELLQRGIKTIGELMKHRDLADRFLDPDRARIRERSYDHSIGSETTLDRPLQETDKMEKVLLGLVEEVGGRLRHEGFHARCITVKIRYSDFKTISRSRTLSIPTCFDREIFDAARDLLGKNLASNRPVRLLGITASSLQSSGWQEPLFEIQKRRSRQRLYDSIDRLREKYGGDAVRIAALQAQNR